jgi:hypothetical protein
MNEKPPRETVNVPDSPQRIATKVTRVTIARRPPVKRARVWAARRPTSSAIRWSGLSVSRVTSCIR